MTLYGHEYVCFDCNTPDESISCLFRECERDHFAVRLAHLFFSRIDLRVFICVHAIDRWPPPRWPGASTKQRPSDNNAGAAASAKKGNLKLSRRLLSDGVNGALMTNPLPHRGGKSMANKTEGFTPPLGLENSRNSEGKP